MRISRIAIVFASMLFFIPAFGSAHSGDVPVSGRDDSRIDLVKVDGSELTSLRNGFAPARPLSSEGLTFSRTPTAFSKVPDGPMTPDVSLHYQTGAPPKGSDAEGEKTFYDYPNGSRLLTPVDSVAGSLSYDPPPQGSSDWIDWYKFSLADIDPSPGASNGLRNITFTLNSFKDGAGGYTLYEYALTPLGDGNYTLSQDYADIVDLQFLYYDPTIGPTYFGGWSLFYDDMDDSDGWSWRSNWTLDYVAPVPSTGPEDHDGFANGLSEVGWYYVGIAINWYQKNGAPDRGSFGVRYDLTVDSSRRQNTDQGANDIDVSGQIVSDQVYRVFSRYNNVDWYKVEGNDPAKLWNMSFNITRTGAVFLRPTPPLYFDTWMHAYMFWHNPGPDDIWGNDDDGMYYYHFIFSAYLSGGSGDAFFISGAGQWVRITLKNDWIVPDKREVYFGFFSEPTTIYNDGVDPFSYTYPNFFALSEYKVKIDIIEESVNRAPVLTTVKFASDWGPDPSGGNLGSIYTFDVTYTDPDNDPPATLFMQIDTDTVHQKEYDLLGKEVNKADKTFTDGKQYRFTLTGDEIGEGTHDFMVKTSDSIPIESLRKSIAPDPVYKNHTLKVWDDYPVIADPEWGGFPTFTEDEPMDVILLTESGTLGPFSDPESGPGDIMVSVKVWDEHTASWSDSASGNIVKLSIIEDNELKARIEPLPDKNGVETFKLQATDAHSSVERTVEVRVDPVNDLPVISSLTKDGKDYSVTLSKPGSYEADLTGTWTVMEDKKLEFSIVASDVDLSGSLQYAYLPDDSDPWLVIPLIDSDGLVTLTPHNNDLNHNTLAFSVSDGTGSVQLSMEIKVKNTNDPPTISFRMEPKKEYLQFDRIAMRPTGVDEDPNDRLTYSVNMESGFGSKYPSVIEQLGDPDISKSDWSVNPLTGEFSFDLKDQSIWGYGPDRDKVKRVTLAFKATDIGGLSTITSLELTLTDVNEGPPAPQVIKFDVSQEDLNQDPWIVDHLAVHLWVDPVEDPDGDTITYVWDLGDGKELQGRDINYTYASAGTRSVRVWATDGEFDSDILTSSVATERTIIEKPVKPDGKSFPWVIVIIVLAVLIIIVLVMFFIMKRSKGVPPQTLLSCPDCGGGVGPSMSVCPSCRTRLK